MKRTRLFALILCPVMLAGCAVRPNTSPTPAVLAPGYLSAADQNIGEGLAALNAFVKNESQVNYPALSATQQATEKPYLNNLILAVNGANIVYQAYHSGAQTFEQAQAAYNSATAAQQQLVSVKGVR